MTHEFKQVLWVSTPLGDGIAILHIDYGPQHNGTLMVALESGEIKYMETNQVRMCRNDTAGISCGPKRVVAMRNVNVPRLMGKMGTGVSEKGSSVTVQFEDETQTDVVERTQLLFL